MNTPLNNDEILKQQKRALQKIWALKEEVATLKKRARAPVAVVGIGCRFPGNINSLEDYWKVLKASRDCIGEIPAERWNVGEYYHHDPAVPGKMYVKEGGFLKGIDQFDADFFNLSFREAGSLDPQQRLLLEVAWEALENANLEPRKLSGSRTGVFLGICTQDYARYSLNSNQPENINIYSFTGNAPSIASGRLSNILDLRGPAVSFDTACSSSLVALHMAVQSLRIGEIEMALAGGVNVILSPENFIYFCKVNALSPDARCKTFDNAANGYIRSEGCGVVALKLLSTALADGDQIHGVIRGSALNQDGRSHGLTAPNGSAQRALIQQALADAGLQPDEISFVETHGTGTPLGDPIEVGALAAIYGQGRPRERALLLGAVKSNIGHTEAASGMAGLIKTLLCLKHGAIPANLHFKQPSSNIDWANLPIRVSDKLQDWPDYAPKKIAGVSAFGFSGTNAHVIVEQAPLPVAAPKTARVVKTEFRRKRCWLQPANQKTIVAETNTAIKADENADFADETLQPDCHPLLGRPHYHCLSDQSGYESFIDIGRLAYLRSHPVWGKIVMPGSGYVEMAIAAALKQTEEQGVLIDNLLYQEAFIIREDRTQRLQMSLAATENGASDFQICSLAGADEQGNLLWRRHATGTLRQIDKERDRKEKFPDQFDRKSVCARCQQHFDAQAFYQRLDRAGYYYGSDHQGVRQAWLGEGEIVCQVACPVSLDYRPQASGKTYFFHPALLDSCYQPLLMLLPPVAEDQMYVTLAKEQVKIHCRPSERLWVHTRRRMDSTDDNTTVKADVYIYDEMGVIVAETRGYVMGRTSAEGPCTAEKRETTAANAPGVYYRTAWQRLFQHPRATPLTGVTLIFADRQGYGIELYVQMQAQGIPCILLHRGETVHRITARQHYEFVTGDAEEFAQVFAQMHQDGVKLATVANMIYCWGLDDHLPSGAGMDIAFSGIQPLAALLGWLIRQPLHCPLTVITRKAQDVTSNMLVKDHPVDTVAESIESVKGAEENSEASAEDEGLTPENLENVEPLQAAYWGLVKVVHEEQPHLNLGCIDIDFDAHQTSHFSRLIQQLISDGGERLLSLRDENIYVPRLSEIDHVANNSIATNTPLALKLADRGNLSRLNWIPRLRRALQPHEVEIAVKATGLNLRDIVDALGLHPRRLDEFGLECSGIISAVGEAVSRVAPGDEVMAFGTGCLAQYCVVDENRVVRKPAQLGWVQTASIPIAFLTAYYALIHCAKIAAGDRVLIHAAAGGVGMAAVQLALQAGAHVYATASREKWSTLNALGVKYVTHSRNLTFADDINRWTDNGGVNVVLNSLADEFIGKSVSLLKEGGRFIEIGLKGWSVQAMQKERVDVDYHIVNLMAQWESDPAAVRFMLDELLAMFERGSLTPLPCECFDSHAVIPAFRRMQQGKHTGKVIVRQASRRTDNRFAGTQIITGGLGAIGLKVAEHLVSQGCRQIALLSRRCVDAQSEKMITALHAQDADVRVYQVDIVSPGLDAALRDIRRNMGPIKGVFHTAGLADDRPIQDLDPESFEQVFKPKVAGTYRLHRLTLTDNLNYFVLFSSMTSILGSVGVANYAAANAFMNSFAQYRNRFGLPAVSLAWGPWANTGLFQTLSEQYRHRLQRCGLHVLDDRQNLVHLTNLLTQSGVIGVFSIDWMKWLQQGVSYKENPFFSRLKKAAKIAESQQIRASNLFSDNPVKKYSLQTGAGQKHSIIRQLQDLPSRQRRQRLIYFLQVQLADVLALDDAGSIDINTGFFDMGIDSLTSIEFRNRLQSCLSGPLPVTALYDYPSVTSLADFILTHIQTTTEKTETQQAFDISSGTGERARSAGKKTIKAENSTFADVMAISEEELVARLMR